MLIAADRAILRTENLVKRRSEVGDDTISRILERFRIERSLQENSHSTPLDVLTRPTWFAPLLLALATGLSYVYADRNVPIPDEGQLLTAAVKILRGGVFFRDVDAYALACTNDVTALTNSSG